MDNRAAYERAAARVRDLVDDSVADVEIPTCPGWTVKDMVSHFSGFITTYRDSGPKGFDEGWAERKVDARAEQSLQECLAEWAELAADPGDLFDTGLGQVAVADILAHEQDIRTALDRPGARDDEHIPASIQMGLSFLKGKVEDVPAVRLVTPDLDEVVGDGEPAATLRTSTFELFRVLHGRRTPQQLGKLDWDGEPGPWLESLFLFGPTEREVEPISV
jgi:uncharacterized protein (TIGR03083 family)